MISLLTVKTRQGDSLKSFIGYFQSKQDKVFSCGEDVFTLAFINGLQVSHPMYKHLLKHNVTRMCEILSQSQPYIQLEEAMKCFANHSTKRGDDREKSKPQYKATTGGMNSNWGQPTYKRQALLVLSPSSLQAFKLTKHFTPLRLRNNEP